jgi:superfamily II RNA helicase
MSTNLSCRRTKKRDIYVISTQKRPVPLEHFLFTASATPSRLVKVVDASKSFLQDGYTNAWNAVHISQKDADKNKAGAKSSKTSVNAKKSSTAVSAFYAKTDRNLWTTLLALLRKQSLLPTVIFTFSKKRCEEYGKANSETASFETKLNAPNSRFPVQFGSFNSKRKKRGSCVHRAESCAPQRK